MSCQFSDFYNSLDPDPLKRGKQFEHFVKWFLKADPEWATQVDQVWLWDEWPERWGADCGIDLVILHKDGGNWAVQAKCYAPDHHITKHDVDKFLSESNRPSIQHRLLIATTDFIGGNARQVCDAQEKPVVRFLLSDFEKSALEYPANFAALPQAKRKPRPEPRDHQSEARTAVVQGLQTADRGQLIMACGTGKTYVTLWIKEHLDAQRTLVLVPSLGLLSQLLREWTFAAATPFEVLCVCSDQTVGSKGHDEAIHSVADLAFPVTSDVGEVKSFLSGAGNRVVFSTYQSSSVIAAAQADPAIPAFDLAVADEAHRCAGKVGSDFTAILDNAQIRSAKRLFATATPRTYSSTVHKAAEDRGVEVVGMDNATLFGEVLYALPFGKAIECKLLTDYRVVIIGVDDPTIAQWIARRELVSTGTGIETDSESLAAQIGLLKAIKDYDLKRIISFHSRVNRAEAFTTDMQNTMQWISDEHRPSGTLRTDFVSGNMPANKRKIKLDQLKGLSADERGMLSNARCLSEGVDVPSLDGVAFIDPRSSQVDIIQAVGRAIRLSADKKIGTIVLPVFIEARQNAEDTIEASHFKPIWDVLSALKAHDDVLACELDQIRTEMGQKPNSGVSADGLRKIRIDLPATVDASFGSVLRTYLVEQVTASWNFFFGLLEAFVNCEGHCLPPALFKTSDGYRLGQWVGSQRSQKDSMTPERKVRLEALPGWVWDSIAEQWEVGFRYLKEFANHEGHCGVLPKYQTADGYRLGQWVGSQRSKKDSMALERKVRLEDLSGWSWEPRDEMWEKRFSELLAYKVQHGDVNVPTDPSNKLWVWVRKQRQSGVKGSLSQDRLQRLVEIGFNWDPLASKWDEMFNELLAYKAQHGDVNVPDEWPTPLGAWVGKQRSSKRSGKLSDDRLQRLVDIGFLWDANESRWEARYGELLTYKEKHGDINIPIDRASELWRWVSTQRIFKKKGKLPANKTQRLDAIGFIWDLLDFQWESKFRELLAYKAVRGNVNVPNSGQTGLGAWVSTQRAAKKAGEISDERIQRLDEIGFEWERGNKLK